MTCEAHETDTDEGADDCEACELNASRASYQKAIRAAGFRISPDLNGEPTLWCIECGRDSGFHHHSCSKLKSSPIPCPQIGDVVERNGHTGAILELSIKLQGE